MHVRQRFHGPITVEELDEKSVPEPNTGCRLWMGNITDDGYGVLVRNGKKNLAHRLSFSMRIGEIPVGLSVLHRCDNPPCINPAHLFLGTQSDNIADMKRKGRVSRGESHFMAKLTSESVAEIKRLLGEGMLHAEVAARFRISMTTVSYIKTGRTWVHVKS